MGRNDAKNANGERSPEMEVAATTAYGFRQVNNEDAA